MSTADDRGFAEEDSNAPHGPPPVGLPTEAGVMTSLEWATDRMLELISELQPQARPPDPPARFDASADRVAYRRWIEEIEGPESLGARTLPRSGPLISVLVPVFRPKTWYFRACVDSVVAQSYWDWELRICDDGSRDADLTTILDDLQRRDKRISTTAVDENGGISRATNTALKGAQGEFVALLDHDDELTPTALAEVAAAIDRYPDADVLYSDDDKMDERQQRYQPHFKPDWAPDLLLSYPYLGHLLVIRRTLLEEVGGFRPEFDGSQDYDVMFRCTEQARRVVHIPKVLYHWRAIAGSAASSADAKPWAHDASRRVVEDALVRQCIDGTVTSGPFPGAYHVRRRINTSPTVSVIVPFRDQAILTVQCLDSLAEYGGDEHLEVVLADNGSTEPETLALRERLADFPGLRIVDVPGQFNWSAINNRAVAESTGELLLFLNNDIQATAPGWIDALVEHAVRPEVGAVGARLLFPDGTLQHGGVALGIGGIAGHLFTALPAHESGYFCWDRVIRPYSAVTAACMMSRREVFDALGGFDEELAVAYNDVDFCLRLGDAGYRVLYTPIAELVHHESISRGLSGQSGDAKAFLAKWGRERLHNDPFYNPNLSLVRSWCPVRQADEEEIWQKRVDAYAGIIPVF